MKHRYSIIITAPISQLCVPLAGADKFLSSVLTTHLQTGAKASLVINLPLEIQTDTELDEAALAEVKRQFEANYGLPVLQIESIGAVEETEPTTPFEEDELVRGDEVKPEDIGLPPAASSEPALVIVDPIGQFIDGTDGKAKADEVAASLPGDPVIAAHEIVSTKPAPTEPEPKAD